MTINSKENNTEKIKIKIKGSSQKNSTKKYLRKDFNSGVFRNNTKNYQYDYEEDFYEPY